MNPLETIKIDNPANRGVRQTFDNVFLRDSCTCAQCVDTSTRQKRFDSADIPSNIRIRHMTSDASNGTITLTWKHDIPGFGPDHTTVLPYKWLKQAPHSPVTHTYQDGKLAWNNKQISKRVKTFAYNDYMSDDRVLFDLLLQLKVLGLVFIKNLPETESSIIQTANRIGPLKNTFYGETWDVRSVSNAKNVAYTDVHLGFHMDLLYMQQPPRLQLLHCLRASEHGGASLFSDSYRAMQQLYDLDQAAFQALVDIPVNFHYDNDNHHYFRSRRTFQLQEGTTKIPQGSDKVWTYMEAVNWAPPFQAPFNHTEGDIALARSMRAWHGAAQTFRDLTELETAVYKRQMEPGECVIFDNRRILHARTAFAGGERWLRGAYLDDDPYLSKMRVLEKNPKHAMSVQAPAKRKPSV
ncbi:Clavaminate synthase-like protein [Aureobasidium namibiae CBS 147.97]|uniref:Clavaminate synthase-like protein n=1 Tax=Aureobasidium namibiae CBS 147.97 TaxID=1043004 RepID=A0A074W4U5_9PEZI|nr:Clavaminate synthase-like protein [Aureobasidium namibiae CBS 147.97]KEQ68120.1 Clavaminate synthase-like protein [Aureobasidium namibiae CBS 147.97]